jgi:hypothetical protein
LITSLAWERRLAQHGGRRAIDSVTKRAAAESLDGHGDHDHPHAPKVWTA